MVEYRDCRSPGRYLPVRTAQITAGPLTTLAPETMWPATAAQSRRAALAAAGVIVPRPSTMRTGHRLPRAGARSEPQGTVTGKVTSASRHPLAGICVNLTTSWGGVGSQTAKNGTYRVMAPSGYNYRVEFTSSCNGFFPTGPWAPEWYKDKFASAPAAVLRVRTGKTISGIDAVMRPQGQVTGSVSSTAGRKLKGVCVVLTTPKGNEVSQTITTANGSYRIQGLDAGGYRVSFVPGCTGQASDYAAAWWPDAASLNNAKPVRVRFGRVTRGINGKLTKLGSISGHIRLVNKSGKPIGGMCVWAYSAGNLFANLPLTSSRPDGSYLLQGIPAGRYGVGVNPGCNNNGNYTTAYYPARIKVTDGKTVAGINIYLQLGGIVSGKVTDAANGKPLGGICVGDGNGDFAASRANGQFRMDQLAAGQVTIGFAGGCGSTGSFAPQWYPHVSSQGAAVSLRITPGHDTSGINAAMLPGSTISGEVTTPAGKKLTGVCVTVVSPEYFDLPVADLGAEAVTAMGTYSISNLGAGQYAVAFYSGCQGPSNVAAPQWFKSQPTDNTAGLISVPAGLTISGINAVVTPGGSITGEVSYQGQPANFACITAINDRTGYAGGGDTFGDPYDIPGLAPGKYTVSASGCGTGVAAARFPGVVTVRAGHTTGRISMTLTTGGSISGRITIKATGAPARGVCLTAVAPGILYGNGATTDAHGRYRIVGLSAGAYHLFVDASEPYCEQGSENLASRRLPGVIRVTAGQLSSGANGALGEGGSVSGRVTGPGGRGVPGACVEAFPQPGGAESYGTTGRFGKYLLTSLVPGRYKVRLGDPGCSDGPANLAAEWFDQSIGMGSATVITVRAGHTRGGVDGVLGIDGTITGAVDGAGSTPLTGICVSAIPASRYLPTVYTAASNGKYTLPELAPGRYRIEFQSGCGLTGLATQWWQRAASRAAATVILVRPGDVVTDINATMKT